MLQSSQIILRGKIMKKFVILAVAVAAVIGGGAVFLVTRGHNDNSVKVTNTNTGNSQEIKTGDDALVAVDACDVLTETAAKQVLGDVVKKGETAGHAASSDDLSVSNCSYDHKTVTTGPALAQAQSADVVGVLARAAKTKAGADSNKGQFTTAKPAGVQDVSGYGDKAFWNPQYGQLNILKGNNWYIISHYTGLNATKGTLEQAKQLADAINNNLK